MKLLYRLAIDIFGYDFVLNLFAVECLASIFLKREICLLLKNSLDLVENCGKHTVYTDVGKWYH